MIRLLYWLSGWRLCLDGYWVRARLTTEPDLKTRPDIGFTDEACIAARSPEFAREVDLLADADLLIRHIRLGCEL